MKRKASPISPRSDRDEDSTRRLLSDGVLHSKAGRFDEAVICFNRALEHDPNNVDALHLSGVVAANRRQFEDATHLIGRAIALKPNEPVFHVNLGNALLEDGQTESAIDSYERALQLRPGDAAILNSLTISCRKLYEKATAHDSKGEYEEADSACRRVLDICPDMADAWHLWGVVAYACGDTDKGIERIHRAILICRDEPNYHNSLGALLLQQGLHGDAIDCFRRALELDPDFANAHGNLALAQRSTGQLEAAIDSLRKVVSLKSADVITHVRLADVLDEVGRSEEAMSEALEAVRIAPTDARTHGQLAIVLRKASRTSEAIRACNKAISLAPETAGNHNTLAMLLKDQGRMKEALECYRRALQLDPSSAAIHSNLLFNLHYADTYDERAIFTEHRKWARRYSADKSSWPDFRGIDRDPQRRLRIGYVSADLRNHSVAHFLEPILAARDGGALEVLCYSNSRVADTTTLRLKDLVDGWRNIAGLNDVQAAAMIRSDAVDILVDLSGHTRGNRIPLFTRKPAPMQVTYLGYPDTTGAAAMDCRFTDEWADPCGKTERFHTEQLVRLQGGFLCYRPPEICPAIGPRVPGKNGPITFGSFNNLSKVNAKTIEAWARILAAIPGSRLMIKSKPLNDKDTRATFHEAFRTRGIDSDRVDLVGWTRRKSSHMALYNEVDVALDTFPYGGTTTTCEALWMGVPVISLAGAFHVSRVGVSLLNCAGLPDMIAGSLDEYVRKAVELAQDTKQLANLRRNLREHVAGSPLTDADRIARSIEAAYRNMWQQFCSNSP